MTPKSIVLILCLLVSLPIIFNVLGGKYSSEHDIIFIPIPDNKVIVIGRLLSPGKPFFDSFSTYDSN